MRNRQTKDKLLRMRANQRKAKERKRLERGESELSQELRWRYEKTNPTGD